MGVNAMHKKTMHTTAPAANLRHVFANVLREDLVDQGLVADMPPPPCPSHRPELLERRAGMSE